MSASHGQPDEWLALLQSGDAHALMAVFREAVEDSPTRSGIQFDIFEFLETHVFNHALEFDLSAFASQGSLDGFDEVAMHRSLLDSREVLTELLSFGAMQSGRAMVTYLRVLRSALRQLFLDTLRRRKLCGNPGEEQRAKAQTVIRAWSTEVEMRLFNIVQSLTVRDAVPQTVSSVNTLDNVEDGINHSEDDEDHHIAERSVDKPLVVSGFRLEVLVALSDLIGDLVLLIVDSSKAVSLLLLLRAAVGVSQPYAEDEVFLNKSVITLRKWSASVCPTLRLNNDPTAVSHVPEEGAVMCVAERVDVSAVRCAANRELLRLIPQGELVAILSDYAGGLFFGDLMDSLSFDDSERGVGRRHDKTMATVQELMDEKKTLFILSDAESDEQDYTTEEGDDNFADGSLSLRRVGIMFFICDLMLLSDTPSQPLFTTSPEVLMFLTGPMVLEALRSCSLTAVMTAVTFLSTLLTSVPPYGVSVFGEGSDVSGAADHPTVFGNVSQNSLTFSTKKFELMFEIAKSLVSISTTCPVESPRLISRAAFTHMVQRCAHDLRLRMFSSFLVLSPFASVCSMMIHAIRGEWGGDGSSFDPSDDMFMRNKLPNFLLRAQEGWLKRLKIPEVAFLDPMIQSINFVRCIISEDSRRSPSGVLFRHDKVTGKVKLCEMHGKSEQYSPWEWYFYQFTRNILPALRDMSMKGSDASDQHKGFLPLGSFTPLDQFSLSMAVGGLENHMVVVS
uniref:Uncharacterized protein n=1 Tax=Trypanosoma congolense (strain IL3000) TaxID=1068625 RepID=G0UZ11_TRYCI|nr:conserved hypothetical protein [Trypanosoma congolense IL3000]